MPFPYHGWAFIRLETGLKSNLDCSIDSNQVALAWISCSTAYDSFHCYLHSESDLWNDDDFTQIHNCLSDYFTAWIAEQFVWILHLNMFINH